MLPEENRSVFFDDPDPKLSFSDQTKKKSSASIRAAAT
jgi:hypothetical protein